MLADNLTETQFCGPLEIRFLIGWQRGAIRLRMRKAEWLRYECFPLTIKMLSIALLTTNFSITPRIWHWRTHYLRHQADVWRCYIVSSNQWAPIRTHTNSLRSAERVSDECGPLCFVSPPIPSPTWAKITWCKDRTPYIPTSVVAYADDVTIFVTSAADFAIMEEAILLTRLQMPDSALENLRPSR